ncbi:DEAD/DEAH box helicase [Haloprofundus sp. MHR1]|uniref:DEAD/DEAH box helicase n=1 Tax=Haloprofundus sp. MHR1 TaxID=2572921 RepID=UPI0010BECD4B|nr:DEAD/DEAH box helicase [Haloprofundus sp. MHR1]QCJ45650.1 DEAD/DEAH box helicase [Haloprofundus sp. MHR1]
MKYFDRNSNPSRMDEDIRPLLRGLLENTQIFGPDDENPRYVTDALKYTRKPQKRRDVEENKYRGEDPFIDEIVEIFGFDPLDFQADSWRLVRDLDATRQRENRSQGAIFSAPTGFGKTEAFLGPLYQLLRDGSQEMAVLVYPSRALLQDQLGRILKHLHQIKTTSNDQLSVGIWTGDTPYDRSDVENQSALFERSNGRSKFRLANCWCGDDDENHSFIFTGGDDGYELVCENDPSHSFTSRELILNRTDMRHGGQPNLLLTTLESLELFGLKPNYDIIDYADTIVFDEIHLYTGLRGAHTANIVKNIESVTDDALLWLGSSATVDDAKRFTGKIFPVPTSRIESVSPAESDFDTDHNDEEHYYFLKSTADGPGVSSMFIQQIMLLGHGLLQQNDAPQGKILSFIDSISQVNQKRSQLEDADQNRQLWEYHVGSGEADDWERVAEEMGYDFLNENLDFASVYSDVGFDASVTESDVLLSTNFLEVGIDVGDITIVTQYRTPWNLSSFVQRAGRAARKEGTDSHIFVFLSDLTADSNMFYRADRFLGSEIRTPLKTDNEVVEWIHDQFETFYAVMSGILDEGYISTQKDKDAFYKAFLVDELGWGDYYTLLTNPSKILSREFDIYESFDAFTGQRPVMNLLATLEGERERLNQRTNIAGTDGNRGTEVVVSLTEAVRENILRFIQERVEMIETCRSHPSKILEESELSALEEKLESLRAAATDDAGETDALADQFQALLPNLFHITGDVMLVTNQAQSQGVDVGGFQFQAQDIQEQVTELRELTDDDEIGKLERQQKQVYYLMQALEEVHKYHKIETNYLSLYFIKHLLRGGYYYDRFLRASGKALSDEVWYIPDNYFDDAGKYFTVFSDENRIGGSEEPIDKLVHSYTPLRSEYQQDAGHLQAFVPKTVIEDGTVRFDFSDIDGEERPDLLIPESIILTDITDLSGTQALNIVRYCPQCLQIIDDSSCLRHNDSKLGKIHASPNVETTLTERSEEQTRGGVTLADISGKVRLTGTSLEITPATYNRSSNEYIFTGGDRIKREIEAPQQTLGFTLDTRGLLFDISTFLDAAADGEIQERVRQYKSFDETSPTYVAAHTAAHFYTQFVADLAGISPNSLFYGVDLDNEEVYVFERSQGGQGIADMVFDDLREDPATVLESITRISYNPQVLNERLWADSEFVEKLPPVSPDRETIETLVRESDVVPIFDHIVDLVVEEVRSSIDRAGQLAKEETTSRRTAYHIKHVVARERVAGNDEFPRVAVSELDPDFDGYERAERLFFSPDIDGCVDNLHLSECISPHDQSDALSYVFLELLREQIIERVPSDEVVTRIFDIEALPGGDYDGTSVFVTL